MFWITALVYAIGVVFFALTVSGEKQPWNDDPTGDGWLSSDDPGDEESKTGPGDASTEDPAKDEPVKEEPPGETKKEATEGEEPTNKKE